MGIGGLGVLAEELWEARVSGALLDPPSRRLEHFSIADGYAIGRMLTEKRLAAGDRVVGLKLGFTNERIWAGLGLDSPFWSPIYESSVLDAGDDVALGGFVAPRIEPEIVLGLNVELGHAGSSDEVASGVRWAALGFEVVHCHYEGWRMTPADAIADGGLHGLLVIGDRVLVDASGADLLSRVDVTLRREGDIVERGSGAAALGGPVEALRWLGRLPGVPRLGVGAVLTTGTLTSAMSVAPAETWRVEADGPVPLGHLEVAFS